MEKDPVTKLGERSQARGAGNYREAYIETAERCGEQQWMVFVKDVETGLNTSGDVCASKAESRKQAAARLLLLLEARDSGAGTSVNSDAFVGDKVLALCLALHLRDQGITEPGPATLHVSHRLSNEALQRNAHKVGVEVSGTRTHHDGSLVEQHAYKVFLEEGLSITRAAARLAPLYSDYPRN